MYRRIVASRIKNGNLLNISLITKFILVAYILLSLIDNINLQTTPNDVKFYKLFNSMFCFRRRIALAIPTTTEGRERCRMYAVNYSEVLEQGLNVSDPSWPTMPCRDGWEYNYTEVPYPSIASEVKSLAPLNWARVRGSFVKKVLFHRRHFRCAFRNIRGNDTTFLKKRLSRKKILSRFTFRFP